MCELLCREFLLQCGKKRKYVYKYICTGNNGIQNKLLLLDDEFLFFLEFFFRISCGIQNNWHSVLLSKSHTFFCSLQIFLLLSTLYLLLSTQHLPRGSLSLSDFITPSSTTLWICLQRHKDMHIFVLGPLFTLSEVSG